MALQRGCSRGVVPTELATHPLAQQRREIYTAPRLARETLEQPMETGCWLYGGHRGRHTSLPVGGRHAAGFPAPRAAHHSQVRGAQEDFFSAKRA